MAYSPSRCAASSRATATRAAAASRNSSTAVMASSERDTPRLVAVPASTESRLVDRARPEMLADCDTVWRSAETCVAIALNLPSGIAGMSG
jgi:hypothetical protein